MRSAHDSPINRKKSKRENLCVNYVWKEINDLAPVLLTIKSCEWHKYTFDCHVRQFQMNGTSARNWHSLDYLPPPPEGFMLAVTRSLIAPHWMCIHFTECNCLYNELAALWICVMSLEFNLCAFAFLSIYYFWIRCQMHLRVLEFRFSLFVSCRSSFNIYHWCTLTWYHIELVSWFFIWKAMQCYHSNGVFQ